VRASLEDYTTNDILVNDARLILQEEIAFKQRKVWRYGKKSFTQMHEDRDLENQIGVEVYQLDLTVMQQIAEEFTSGEVEAVLEEERQDYNFIRIQSRNIFPLCRSPFDHGTFREKVFLN
jgi:hypothetical protein